ncbi:MAG: peptidoglycan DD-metalloendopeptidase family protein [Xanthomonadales bacterium]|nr:peptidoglycan DD-metalloendopeptidase family protein [Xanthomonadales bacterium]
MRVLTRLAGCLVAALVASLTACAPRSPAPIYDRSSSTYPRSSRVAQIPSRHAVRKGDTLYAIAWRYRLDFRDVARWNGISKPYLIYPGQQLRLSAPPAPRRVARTSPPASASPGKPSSRSSSPAGKSPVVVPVNPSVGSTPAKPSAAAKTSISWQWPTSGSLLMRFSQDRSGYNGIDISGRPGQAVQAAASGEVVYSGAGLVGYGELIIIKHDERFLSAYGHNRKRLVKEGDTVRQGQKIAEMGDTGTDQPKLHFEIRNNGKSVDPLKFLPSRDG